MRYICDTNFILSYLIQDNEQMATQANKLFEQAKTGKVIIILEQTVFTEVIFVLSSFYKIPRNEITARLSELLTYKGIESDKESMLLALEYYNTDNLSIVDCLLAAKSRITEISLLTFEKKLAKFANTVKT